jgi:hypothetical protein
MKKQSLQRLNSRYNDFWWSVEKYDEIAKAKQVFCSSYSVATVK